VLKNIVTVLSGTVIAQLVALAAMPLLSRLYSPEDFGHFQIFTSAINILLMVVSFRYEVAILSVAPGTSLKMLLGLVLRLCVLTSGATWLVVWLVGSHIEEQIQGFGVIGWLIAPGMLVAGIYHALSYLPIRNLAFRLSATTKLVQVSGYVGASIALIFTPFSSVGMVIGDIVGRFVGGLVTVGRTEHLFKELTKPLPLTEIREAAWQFRKFPLMTFPGTLLSALTAGMVPITFAKLYGIEVAGHYALVDRFVLVPVGVIAFAVGQVFTGGIVQALREHPQEVYPKFKQLVLTLSVLGLLGACTGFLTLPWGLPIILGSQWALSGELAAWAMPMALAIFVASPVNMVLLVSGHNVLQLIWEIVRFLIMFAGFSVVVNYQVPPTSAMAIAAMASLLAYGIFLGMAWHVLAKRHIQPEQN
jgi:O-antigen/teichoic acid export membrane protein